MSASDDDAPEWSADVFERAEIKRGGEVVRPASGTLTKPNESMLERAARAAGEVAATMTDDVRHVLSERALEDVARAVLMAVREPDDAMLWDGVAAMSDANAENLSMLAADLCFTAMIEAILNETPA